MVRAPRADACRNRDRLLDVAAGAFAAGGVEASLERIAAEAGVGIGTLYRHFPTRDALVEAVYRHNVDQLCAAADDLGGRLPPDQALAEWMGLFVAYAAGKKGLASYLKTVVSADSDLFESSLAQVRQAVGRLMAAAVTAGTVRPGVEGMDVLRALSGACLVAGDSGGSEQTARVAALLMDGLRYGARTA